METLMTNGVRVSIESFYQPQYSNPQKNCFAFRFRAVIENMGMTPICIKGSKVFMTDCYCNKDKYGGEGVAGQQPIISPEHEYEYFIETEIGTEIAKLKGVYLVEDLQYHNTFEVRIPKFIVTAPCKYN